MMIERVRPEEPLGIPRRAVDRTVLASVREAEQLRSFNNSCRPFPHDRLIHELFESQVERTPNATAIICEGLELTYRQLNCSANQLARYLQSAGVRVGEPVPIVMPRSPQMIICQLAVLKCGAVYVPIDPDLPGDRQSFMLADCQARCALFDSEFPIDRSVATLRWLDFGARATTEMCASLPSEDLGLQIATPHPAYVMYTSGSTGTPKGVLVAHRGVNRLVINCDYVSIDASDCIAHCSNPAFDASTFEVWAALLNGARLLVVPHSVLLDPASFSAVLRRWGVSVLFLTTALFNRHVIASSAAFSGLKYLLFGGEIANAAIVRKVLLGGPPQHLANLYGPTETTTFATYWPVTSVAKDATHIPIGRPIANTRIYILDEKLHPVRVGDTGELFIGGPGVAFGYLNRPDLTAEKFISDPFVEDEKERMYRTGDLGRWLADGTIEFLGRNDLQVKMRGFRIELSEIQAQLSTYDGVRETVVLLREDTPGSQRLVAYVTAENGAMLSLSALRQHMVDGLPGYMVPAAYVVIEILPLTSNGKVDRGALPPPDESAVIRREYTAPQGEIEMRVATVWQEALHVAQVSRRDNFFELGGDSLVGMDVIVTLTGVFGVQIGFLTLFRCPTVQELAQYVQDLLADARRVVHSN